MIKNFLFFYTRPLFENFLKKMIFSPLKSQKHLEKFSKKEKNWLLHIQPRAMSAAHAQFWLPTRPIWHMAYLGIKISKPIETRAWHNYITSCFLQFFLIYGQILMAFKNSDFVRIMTRAFSQLILKCSAGRVASIPDCHAGDASSILRQFDFFVERWIE